MTENEIETVLDGITYKEGYWLQWSPLWQRPSFKVWWSFKRLDATTGVMGFGKSGYVSFEKDGLTEEALVRGVWGMTLRLEEHEAREFFMYGDQKPFDPHQVLIKSRLEEK